jgi:hypothetical protein
MVGRKLSSCVCCERGGIVCRWCACVCSHQHACTHAVNPVHAHAAVGNNTAQHQGAPEHTHRAHARARTHTHTQSTQKAHTQSTHTHMHSAHTHSAHTHTHSTHAQHTRTAHKQHTNSTRTRTAHAHTRLWHVGGRLAEGRLAPRLAVDQHQPAELPHALAASQDVHQRGLAGACARG